MMYFDVFLFIKCILMYFIKYLKHVLHVLAGPSFESVVGCCGAFWQLRFMFCKEAFGLGDREEEKEAA